MQRRSDTAAIPSTHPIGGDARVTSEPGAAFEPVRFPVAPCTDGTVTEITVFTVFSVRNKPFCFRIQQTVIAAKRNCRFIFVRRSPP